MAFINFVVKINNFFLDFFVVFDVVDNFFFFESIVRKLRKILIILDKNFFLK